MKLKNKKVMVLGGGIAGLTAAWEMAQQNIDVELVEKADFLGGNGIQYSCKATDQCQQCGACSVEKILKYVVSEPKIKIRLLAEVETVVGAGPFDVALKPVEASEKGSCRSKYDDSPMDCSSAFGYSKHNAELYGVDGKPQAQYSGKAETVIVDALIVASGFKPFDVALKPTYNTDLFENIITGLDLERMKRAKNGVFRPSDNNVPENVAFIQCVGSRDERLGNLYCSQVCCPYALRTATALKHKHPNLDVTIFYMDIQNVGKGFSTFNQNCKETLHFVRTIPIDMLKTEDDKIKTRYMDDDGNPMEATFDMVVLSIGITPGDDNLTIAETIGVQLDHDGFFKNRGMMNRVVSSKKGVFIAGTAQGPKTIAESMAHAGQAACEAMRFIGEAK